mgnify:CR=1 FL=1
MYDRPSAIGCACLSAQEAEEARGGQGATGAPPPRRTHSRQHVLREEISVPCSDAHDIHNDGLPHEEGEAEVHPRQPRCIEGHDAQECHALVRVAFGPHIYHHEGKRRTKEVHLHQGGQALQKVGGNVGCGGLATAGLLTMKAVAPKNRNHKWSAIFRRNELDSSMLENRTLRETGFVCLECI